MSEPLNKSLLLVCPDCGQKKNVERLDTDPLGSAYAELPCLKCSDSGAFESPVFYDVNGKNIPPTPAPQQEGGEG